MLTPDHHTSKLGVMDFVFQVNKWPFSITCNPMLPTITESLIDLSLVKDMKIPMKKVECRSYSYAGELRTGENRILDQSKCFPFGPETLSLLLIIKCCHWPWVLSLCKARYCFRKHIELFKFLPFYFTCLELISFHFISLTDIHGFAKVPEFSSELLQGLSAKLDSFVSNAFRNLIHRNNRKNI